MIHTHEVVERTSRSNVRLVGRPVRAPAERCRHRRPRPTEHVTVCVFSEDSATAEGCAGVTRMVSHRSAAVGPCTNVRAVRQVCSASPL